MSNILSEQQLASFSNDLRFFEVLLFNAFDATYAEQVQKYLNQPFSSAPSAPLKDFSDQHNFQVGLEQYFYQLNESTPFVSSNPLVFSDVHQFLDILSKDFSQSPLYPLLYTSVLQNFAKVVKQKYNWSLLDITQQENLDISLIKEGIKQAFSLPFSVPYDKSTFSTNLFGFGLLCLNNTSHTYRKKGEQTQISLFNEEETLDIAKTLFKYHPTFIFSVRHFGSFPDLSGSNFLPFFSKVWDITGNNLLDTISSSAFTPYFDLLEKTTYESESDDIEDNFYLKTFISYALQGNTEQVIDKLKQLQFILSKNDDYFYSEDTSSNHETLVANKIKDENLSLDDYRIFFTNKLHIDIFCNSNQKNALTFVENSIREIQLTSEINKIEKKSSQVKKGKI